MKQKCNEKEGNTNVVSLFPFLLVPRSRGLSVELSKKRTPSRGDY